MNSHLSPLTLAHKEHIKKGRTLFAREKIVYVGDKENPLVYYDGYIRITCLSHRLQLACHMLLVEKIFEKRPRYGIIKYADNSSFKVNNTPELQRALAKKINRFEKLKTGDAKPVRNHTVAERCHSCKYYAFCKQRLRSAR